MTPVPVPDESMPDVIADEPDTSKIPVLPNSVYAPVTRETPSVQQPVTPHVDVQPESPPPASSADDDPMPLPHVDDTPPWVYQEPETPWISTEQDTPATIPQQVPLPPIQVSPSREETNMSTCDSIIPLPPWFDETPQPSSTIHEDILPPTLSFVETPFVTVFHLWQSVGDLVRFFRFQKLRRFHLWRNVGALVHFISRILYQSVGDPIRCILRLPFRQQRPHTFAGAPVFCVLCVHFEDSETHNQIPRNV